MRTRPFAIAAALLALGMGACNFDILNTNQPTLNDLLTNPTRQKISTVATGLFAGARSDMQAIIWRVGSMGREAVNLSGNNQPDFIEPYFGPVVAGGSFGGTMWIGRYANIRTANVFLTALAKVPDVAADPVHGMTAVDKAGSRGMANTLKALAFMYVIELRAQLGAPVEVDLDISATPAPFASEDSVYRAILGLLDSARADLVRADTFPFPFLVPPGLSGLGNALDFSTPATFIQFNRALAAKANVLRATDTTAAGGCGGNRAACYDAALVALGASFLSAAPADLQKGAYFDFSSGPGDITNSLSEPLDGPTFFALQDNFADAELQAGGQKDQRVLDKIAPAKDTSRTLLGSIPIPGELKFTIYMTNGQADEAHPIPIIKNEELLLLRAEANWFGSTPDKSQALIDLNIVRQNSGKLPVSTVTTGSPDQDFVTALMYERRFSLLWEQGTRWIDARRFRRLSDIPTDIPPTFKNPGAVPPVMPIPKGECDARNLTASEVIPDVVTCRPPLAP